MQDKALYLCAPADPQKGWTFWWTQSYFHKTPLAILFRECLAECLDTPDLPLIPVQSFCFCHIKSVCSKNWEHGAGVYEFWLLEKNFHHDLAPKRLISGITQTIAVRSVHFAQSHMGFQGFVTQIMNSL